MDDAALDRSNSANSKKPRDQRTSWDYEYEPSSCKTAIGTLFGYFKQIVLNTVATSSETVSTFDCRVVCVCV
jgi:hypothetical protein